MCVSCLRFRLFYLFNYLYLYLSIQLDCCVCLRRSEYQARTIPEAVMPVIVAVTVASVVMWVPHVVRDHTSGG